MKVTVTLLPRFQLANFVVHSWLKLRGGKFIKADYTPRNLRLTWLEPITPVAGMGLPIQSCAQ